MNKMMSKLLEKKKQMGHEMDPIEKDAKMSVIDSLRKAMQDEMGGRLKDMKKVSVMSDSHEGLKEGLNKAKEILSEAPGAHSDGGEEDPGKLAKAAHEGDEEAGKKLAEHEMSEYGEHPSNDQEGDEYSEENMPEGYHDSDVPSDEEGSEYDEDEINQKLERLMAMKQKKAASKKM